MRVMSIDPDAKKSGYCILNGPELMTVGCAPFADILAMIEKEAEAGAHIVVEAGWLETANWHVKRGDTPQKAAAIGRAVGMNHQTGMLIVEWCRAQGFRVEEVHPLRKCWRGRDGKITREELQAVTGLKLPITNQDARDAVLIAWIYSGNRLRALPGRLAL